MQKSSPRFDSLDLLRGLAALLVLVGHSRVFLFQSFADVQQATPHPGVAIIAFYLVTGLGRQAVLIFFALSGFLVGGKALDDILGQRFSWPRYLSRRLTRLWLVIVPALVLTLLLDGAGSALVHGAGYDGRYFQIYNSGPRPEGLELTWSAFLGNVLFLQSIAVPVFGANGPMWSLANEFWYYIMFPLVACLVLARQATAERAIAVVVLGLCALMLPPALLADGLIWIAGAAAAWASRRPSLAGMLTAWPARLLAPLGLVAVLVVSKVPGLDPGSAADGSDVALDIPFGLAIAMTLPVLARMPNFGGSATRVSRAISEVSYTLYLTHFPLLTFIMMVAIAPGHFRPGPWPMLLLSGFVVVSLVWAALLWWCFERHTDRVYARLVALWPIAPPPAPRLTPRGGT